MNKFEIGIIGGGAAGLMAAISAVENGSKSVSIFESNVRCGTKILMSGGTRCNVTNEIVKPDHFFGGNKNFIKNVLAAFDVNSTLKFFSRLGVELKLEPTGKYFPVDNKAISVLNSLLKRCDELGVKIFTSTKILLTKKNDSIFTLHSKNEIYEVEKLIITTGGKSYPTTGSDGSGYEIAKSFGHKINLTFPALTPILLNEPKLQNLSGITITAKLILFINNKKHFETENSLLLTHFGLSGPCALNISREADRLKNEDIKLILNFLPEFTYDTLIQKLKEIKNINRERSVLNFFKEKLPLNLCLTLFEISKVDSSKKFNVISNDELKKITNSFSNYELKFAGVKGFAQAEVTAGGIPLDEIKFQTMESKLISNLFFAGEILDVDGIIGGYNFQWAWSTGFIAGKAASSKK